MQLSLSVLYKICSFISSLPPSVTPLIPQSITDQCELFVTTPTGTTYYGTYPEDNVRAWLGIPYAKPPVGLLRWKPAQPITEFNKDEVVNATWYGNTCHQLLNKLFYRDPSLGEVIETVTKEDEDCLTLNIWTPKKKRKEGELLPVMVWIYGGAFTEGGTSHVMYNASQIVKNHDDIIVASLNYRVNIFGFPYTAAVPLNETNLGLLDQRAAIIWLRDNLAAFGGDPSKITLFGESAGSVSISTYSFAYPDDPIARAFIMQSGQADMIDPGNPTEFSRVARNSGCGSTGNRTVSEQEEFECMRGKTAEEVRRGITNETLNPFGAPQGGQLTWDNATAFPTEELYRRGKEGKFAKVPVLLGNTHNEGDALVPYDLEKGINYTQSDIITITVMSCPTAKFAEFYTGQNLPVWRYRYMGAFPALTPPPWARAFHGGEISFIFNTPVLPFKPYKKRASDYIQAAWIAFAKDPYDGLSSGEFGWPKYKTTQDSLVELFPEYTSLQGNYTGSEDLVRFVKTDTYDEQCANPPRIPWEDMIEV